MLFDKNDEKAHERILYQTKPNMLLGCKKAIYGIVLLIIILMISPMAIRFIGHMQVHLISQVQLPLTRYTAVAFFVIILINVIYIIWQLVGWYSMEYTLTETKVIVKSGVISTKKNYMPYATIQDINTTQGIVARMFNVGSVSLFSAYDNNQMELKNIYKPSEAEEIIFSRMVGSRNFQAPPQSVPQYRERSIMDAARDEYFERDVYTRPDDYLGRNEVYDEYEPITPIGRERNHYPKREYEYYPEDFSNVSGEPRHTYEYEPYDGRSERTSQRDSYYNEVRDEYSMGSENHYQNNEPQSYYNERADEPVKDDSEDIDNTSQKAIQRHFDKFKR